MHVWRSEDNGVVHMCVMYMGGGQRATSDVGPHSLDTGFCWLLHTSVWLLCELPGISVPLLPILP